MSKNEAEYLKERFSRLLEMINAENYHMAAASILADISALNVILVNNDEQE